MKTHVVIGSNCFTGSHIVDGLLEDPNNVVVGVSRSPEYQDRYLPYKTRSNSNFRFRQIDMVRQFNELVELIKEVHPQIVINVAALSEVVLSTEQPVEYFDINTTAVIKLCNYLRTCDEFERYVHISSAEIFGTCEGSVNEEIRFNPSTPYAVSKAAADMYLNTLISNSQFPATIIRSTNVYGRHQQLFKIIPRAMIYLLSGKTIELHGGGLAVKSFIHIRDVVDGLIRTIERGKTGTYHFSEESVQTIADIVNRICSLLGQDYQKATKVVGERLGQDARYWLDSSKAKRELGWQPQVSFDAGLTEVLEWIKDNWDMIQRDPMDYIHKV